ncbi:hypothetical protein G3I59_21810 [Amycolatopsis rubida]|uniref:Alpha/beta hydrolase n=1 Tax=Amycolatopsis rubida TaxID=112413 RepID=A0ABX0BZB9_9PSEU|nr:MULTISPECIES: hypothetical protein [Amycolatopsis]MYW93179.1 hypothetical protein [Amycolatopsis rubida]NEC58166.1 hypothetical protein [Amycolatopsis rubida]OAP24420.1 hypothetical protein A4R44_04811 [Amycolatopsis sp. M39]
MPEPFPSDPVRAEGPPLVAAGRSGAPRLIVLDPAGAAKHDGLPATWRPLAEDHEILWYRIPVEGAWRETAETLAAPERSDLVTSGPLAADALQLAAEHPGSLRSVLLVDPAAEGVISPGDAAVADEAWLVQHDAEIAALRESGVEVEVLAHSRDDPDDQVPSPLPLGHGWVVDALRETLAKLEAR